MGMIPLEERLREILQPYFAVGGIHQSSALPKAVTEIIQAFKDDGEWYHIPKATQDDWEEAHNIIQGDLLTGAEWYSRFEKELHKAQKIVDREILSWRARQDAIAIKAAKRASNISNEEGEE